jgi:hypothetical protein
VGSGIDIFVSNGNAAAVFMMTVAMLTGMAHLHGSPARRHAPARHWSSTDDYQSPARVELGDARIPVRSVRGSYDIRSRSRGTNPRTNREIRQASPDSVPPPEVIVGYVDPARGPAAFHRLTKVVEGDRVKVVRRDNSVAWFKVDSVRRMVRRSVARERAESGRPELRLISWRGEAHRGDANRGDANRGKPADVVVSAHLDRAPRTNRSPRDDDRPAVER